MTLNGYDGSTHGYNQKMKNTLANDSNHVKAAVPPIGAIIHWAKEYNEVASGTTTSTSTGKLIDSGATFTVDVSKEFIVHNTTDDTWTYIVSVDSNVQLTINDDIFVSGEDYIVYSVPRLPDAWAECDGSTLSDVDSPYNGATLPNMASNYDYTTIYTGTGFDTSSSGVVDTETHDIVITANPYAKYLIFECLYEWSYYLGTEDTPRVGLKLDDFTNTVNVFDFTETNNFLEGLSSNSDLSFASFSGHHTFRYVHTLTAAELANDFTIRITGYTNAPDSSSASISNKKTIITLVGDGLQMANPFFVDTSVTPTAIPLTYIMRVK